jgi:hypothetical protein
MLLIPFFIFCYGVKLVLNTYSLPFQRSTFNVEVAPDPDKIILQLPTVPGEPKYIAVFCWNPCAEDVVYVDPLETIDP